MKPGVFFSYYGSKFSRCRYYPPPRHRVIIEPFAGSAGYAVNYPDHDVRLYDTDHRVVATWRYLIRVKGSELRSLPAHVIHMDDHPALVQEARWLIGWWLHKATTTPRRRRSPWMPNHKSPGSYWSETVRDRLAVQVELVRHWRVYQRSYHEAPDIEATWFIDPPYQGKVGDHYRHRFRNHDKLGQWCRGRSGQVIVCEHAGATWLDFRPLGPTGVRCAREVFWTRAG